MSERPIHRADCGHWTRDDCDCVPWPGTTTPMPNIMTGGSPYRDHVGNRSYSREPPHDSLRDVGVRSDPPPPPSPHELARILGLALYGVLCVPVIVATLFASHLSAGACVGAVLFFWLTLYIGARHW